MWIVENVSKKLYFSVGLIKREWFMIMMKKIAMLALTASAAFSSAFAADECSVSLDGDFVFSGYQVKPSVEKVRCGEEEYTEFSSVVYGKNINAGAEAGSVTITLTNGDIIEHKFEIKRKGIRLIADNCEKELGGSTLKCGENENPTLTWTVDEKNSDLSTLNPDTLSHFLAELNENVKLVVADGEENVGVTFEISGDPTVNLASLFSNYNVIVKSGKMLITKTKIHIVVTSAGKVYGKDDPKFEYAIHGNIAPADYSKLGEITLSRESGDDVGNYLINVSLNGKLLADKPGKASECEEAYCVETDDYYIYAIYGTLVIQPASAMVTVNSVTKSYGDATPEFSYEVTGLVGDDKLEDVEITCASCSATGLENGGKYVLSASVNAKSNPNYKVSTADGSLTVFPKAATVTLEDAEKTYGDKDPEFKYTVDGLVEGESLKGAKVTRDEGENIGTYDVNLSFAEGSNPNYKLTVVPSTLTITQKEVTLKVTDITKKFGEKDPELEFTVDGIVKFGDEEDVLKGVALKREAGEDAGEYAITATVDAKSNPNYIVSTEDGKLTITANNNKIVVTIKGRSETLQYDGKEHTVKGFDISVNNEAYSLKFVEYIGDSIVTGKNAGKYTMGLEASAFQNTSVNYTNVTFNITDGVLQIDPKKLVISAKPDTITYGDEIPAELEWVADSLLEGDELDNIHLSVNKTGLLNAGDYPLTFDLKNPTNQNYVVSKYETATLTVLPKVVTVTVSDAEKVYGDPDPESYKYEVSGLLEGDQLPELIFSREPGENVLKDSEGEDSTYHISAEFKSRPSKNYNVKIRQGEFKILPYPKKITVAIFGEDVVMKYTGEEITVDKKFDVALIPDLECTLPEGYSYSKDFVVYKGEKTVTAKENGSYPMGLTVSDFVNISPNFEHVSFVLSIDGNLVIDEKGPEISLATVKGVKTFGLSSMNRRIQVSGSAIGERYAVHDMKGRAVRSGVVESANFEIPVTNAGVYMVRVGASAKRIRVK